MTFSIHSEVTAAGPAAALLKKAKDKYGFVPNLLGAMADAPSLLKAYMSLSGIFDETSFSVTEKQIILLSVSLANNFSYCMAAHSAMAGMHGIAEDIIEALRENSPIKDKKLEALRRLAQCLTERRGYPLEKSVGNFLDAGYTRAQLLEVVLGVGLKTLSNYTNHIANLPLDDEFKKAEWKPAVGVADFAAVRGN